MSEEARYLAEILVELKRLSEALEVIVDYLEEGEKEYEWIPELVQ